MLTKINMFLSNFSFFRKFKCERRVGKGCVPNNFRREIKEVGRENKKFN
jgi:hypothetical protein